MDDEAYVRELFAILTDPEPTGIDPDDPYGHADDGIDRYDGFGRDVWVESVDVVDGEHGAELVVGFRVSLPAGPEWEGAPREGTVRLPLDAEWRRLSGYAHPSAYAPAVADRVMGAARRLVERHVDGASKEQHGAALPDREAQWAALLDALRSEGAVREVAPGRIEVDPVDGTPFTVVVTPDQWQQVLDDHVGDDPDLYFADLLGPRAEDETFVVFYDGDLVRSTREELPPVRSRAFERWVTEARAGHPDEQVGWYAHPPGRQQDRGDADRFQSPGD